MTEAEWLDIFSHNLQEYLVEYGANQSDFAEVTGLSQMAISNYLNGRRIPNLRALINMAYELGVSLDDFIDFGDRIEG